jgi:Na+/proline symporter
MIATIDIILIAAYFIAIAIVGYTSSKKETAKEFIIADKKLGVWANITTLAATKVTASIMITYLALVYVFGISAMWLYIGATIGLVLYLLFAIKLKKEGDKHNYYSIADYFYHRYGESTGRTITIITTILIFLNFTIQLIGGAMILQSLTGLSFILGILLCAGIILFYLYLGGFKAVVKTDMVQFIAIILLFVVLGIFLSSNFTYQATQWDLMSAGPKMIIPFLIAGILVPFSATDIWQRTLAAKSVKTLKKSFIITTIIYVIFGFVLTMIAIIIKIKLPNIAADTALVTGFTQLLPAGLLGLGLVALFAAIMSSADSFAFISAGLLMQDLIYRNKKHNKVKSLKYGILIVILLGSFLSIAFESILSASYLLTALLMSLSIIVLATWIKKDINPRLIKAPLIIGAIITLAYGLLISMTEVLILVSIISTLVTLIISIVLNAVLKPKKNER